MSNLDKLISHFEKFPGVGARQAKRFAFHILTLPKAEVAEISELITSLEASVMECHSCRRFFSRNGHSATLCSICDSGNRDHGKIMIIERDSDVATVERSLTYDGLYFVLGGTIPLLNDKDSNKLRGGALKAIIKERAKENLTEIILGFSVNPDGENTSRYVETLLKDLIKKYKLKVSQLGRGLSTGSELEYADPETIKNALKNRG